MQGLEADHVQLGGVAVLRDASTVGRTLLLVYPPPGPMAAEAVAAYRGKLLLYVGEGRGAF